MNQQEINKILDDLEKEAEKDIEVVFNNRLKSILDQMLQILAITTMESGNQNHQGFEALQRKLLMSIFSLSYTYTFRIKKIKIKFLLRFIQLYNIKSIIKVFSLYFCV
ncbi:hypothetical protein ACIP9C_15735 [Lysinibacillus sp. NPDC093210]|uniref:hypothetical protein n=1 Tax=Lysinibacillus sp. NPDC093210 TaxID=3364133 RepID=UPI00382CEDDC